MLRAFWSAAAFVSVVSVAAGCSGAPDPSISDGASTSGSPSGSGASSTTSSAGNVGGGSANEQDAGASDDASVPTFGQTAVARATEWVEAKVPYCGGPNGGTDVLCGGTCERTGAADVKAWNPYRSDCSGLVSWAWDLPAPGHTTGDFAPYDTSVSHEINGTDLEPGDALNNAEHVMLFGGWVDKSKGEATILEESDCGLVALTKTVTFTIGATSRTPIDDTTGRVFYAIRYGK